LHQTVDYTNCGNKISSMYMYHIVCQFPHSTKCHPGTCMATSYLCAIMVALIMCYVNELSWTTCSSRLHCHFDTPCAIVVPLIVRSCAQLVPSWK
jgi:hypothetical protein